MSIHMREVSTKVMTTALLPHKEFIARPQFHLLRLYSQLGTLANSLIDPHPIVPRVLAFQPHPVYIIL